MAFSWGLQKMKNHFFKPNYFSNYWIIVGSILSFTILHISYINTPFVNLEWVYKTGTQYFITGNQDLLKNYFTFQANPITYSFIVSNFINFFDIDTYWVYRGPALFGGILLLIALARKENPWLVIIVALNPLVWIYSGRAYSELLALGLMIFAYEFQYRPIASGSITLLSGIFKFHTFPIILTNLGLKWILVNQKNRFKYFFNNQLLTGSIVLIGALTFFSIYQKLFNVWIVPEIHHEALGFSLRVLINNFFSYGFYLSGMFFLTIPAFLNTKKFKLKIILLVPSILLGITNQNLGEMDFGSFQQFLGNEIILLIKIIGFWNFLLCCQIFWKDEESRILLLTILGYILLLSLTRPANRYLIFVVPFWAILVCQHISLSRMFWLGYVSVLAGLNLFATLYQVSNATASANMADWAIQNDVRINLGGILHSHVGDFSHYDPNSPLIVSLAGAHFGRILHEEPVHVLGFQIRSYVLTDTNSN